MAKLYVANCSRQNYEVHYRLDFNVKGEREENARFQPAKRQTIPAGRQIPLGGNDLHISQIEEIIAQLQPYGLVALKEVGDIKSVTPLVFNIDAIVPADAIRRVMNTNSGILIEEGKTRRRKAAVVVNETVADVVAAQFASAGVDKEPSQTVEVEIEQQDQSELGERRIEEGFRIDPSIAASKQGNKGRGAPRR